MPASILDLVNYWSPHPEAPGIWQFKTKYGLMGFAEEDGTTLHVVELHPQHEPKLQICLKFFGEAVEIYDLILVELVRKKDLALAMVRGGFVACDVRTPPRNEYWAKVNRAPSGVWISGMAWNRSMPRGFWTRKSSEKEVQRMTRALKK